MKRLLTATPKRMSYRKAWDYHGIVMFFSRYIPHVQLYITTVSSARLPLDVTNSIFLLPRGEKMGLRSSTQPWFIRIFPTKTWSFRETSQR